MNPAPFSASSAPPREYSTSKGEMVIYQTADGSITTEVRMEAETLWLSEQQIAMVFERDRTVIGRHIKNIIQTGELEEKSNVQKMHIANSDKQVSFYNLDMILSVGYRVNSKRGAQFRIWANRILKEHLVQGYTINQKRLQEQRHQFSRLQESIQLLERSLMEQAVTVDSARNIVRVLAEFSKGLEILDDYDNEKLEQNGKTMKPALVIDTAEFSSVVEALRRDFDSAIFAQPKDASFESSVRQIYQSFAGNELYPSIEHKAAMLLYFVVKNHSFVDGNKRIAAALFLYFLDKNSLLFGANGQRRISDEGLAALTLLIAVSKPEEKNTMVNIVITVLNRSNQ
ncbi:MAG: virulence protein RhuM/Fic/DOC family protein [Deltaproteobacteria bacterium]|nr:virulence protein RhuM/Fic/DOC family protein [Deltaproteobacteria bacterium]